MRGHSIDLGWIVVTVKYLHKKKNSNVYYYRRSIPEEIRSFFSGRTQIMQSLKTTDERKAVKAIKQVSEHYDKEFNRLKNGPTRDKAELLLKEYGLQPIDKKDQPDNYYSNSPSEMSNYEVFEEYLSYKHQSKVGDGYDQPNDVDSMAFDILNGRDRFYLDDAKALFLKAEAHKGKKRRDEINNHFSKFKGVLHETELVDIRRNTVQLAVDTLRDSGLSSASCKKYLGTVKKAIDKLYLRYEIDKPNPFKGIEIVGLGADSNKRETLRHNEFVQLVELIKNKKNTASGQVLGLQLNTGSRIAEVAGLRLEDLVLDAEVPYVNIERFDGRSIKTSNSAREVPLAGLSLEIAKYIKQNALDGQVYVFPQCWKNSVFDGRSITNAVNKMLRQNIDGTKCTSHSMRHTLVDRLKNSDVSEEVIEDILGWSSGKMVKSYGFGPGMERLNNYMQQMLEFESRGGRTLR